MKIILIIVLALIILIVLLLLMRRPLRPSAPPAPQQGPRTAVPSAQNTALPSVPFGSAQGQTEGVGGELTQASLEAFARSFVERYGSYSNQNGFENLEDLYPFMTERLRAATEKFVKAERAAQSAPSASSYAGVTTRALSVRTVSKTETAARLLINAQRQESTAVSLNAKLYYQDIELALKKVGDAWRVDAAIWK